MQNARRACRSLMAAASFAAVAGCAGFQPAQAPETPAHIERRTSVDGWTASDLETAYALPSAQRGKGQSVFVVDAYDNPNAAGDFAQYRSTMGLPPGTLTKYNQRGEQKNYPPGNAGWGLESDLDIEMVSASCPNCGVNLVEADSNAASDLAAAVEEAVRLGATIVSVSYSGPRSNQKAFSAHGVTYVAPAGLQNGVGFPAGFDTVVAVGGTMLARSSNRRGYIEAVWNATGGCVKNEPKPPWQVGNAYAKGCRGRVADDVSAVAQDVAMYDSYSQDGWSVIGGTSIGAPFCAGVFALAGNATKQIGGRTFWTPASHHAHLFKVGGKRYSASAGWGSPDGIGAF